MMKKLLMAMILLSIVLVGCTTAEDPIQHGQRLWLQEDVQARQMVEDFDMFWLFDRASRLTQWHGQTGI
jgi:uncharacterized protein YcfL